MDRHIFYYSQAGRLCQHLLGSFEEEIIQNLFYKACWSYPPLGCKKDNQIDFDSF
jgi:hypothetical protein